METLIILAIVYFIPAIIAIARKHRSKEAIFALNLLLGWTCLGWVIALIWSLTSPQNIVIMRKE